MRVAPWGLAVMLAFAGCAGRSSGDPAAAPTSHGTVDAGPADASSGASANASLPPTIDETGPRTLHFEGTFQLLVTHAYGTNATSSANHRLNLDANCVTFGKTQVWLVTNGTATATWTPSSPLAARMVVQVRDVGLVATNGGATSPTVLPYGPFHAAPNAALGFLFVVQPADTGVVVKQAVTLTLSFDYLGKPELKTQVVPCTYQ